MENEILALNANQVVAYLQKEPREFTKADIIRFIEENDIRAKLLLVDQGGAEVFIDEDAYITSDEERARVYEAQDMEELAEHVENLRVVLDGVRTLFYAPDGGNVYGEIKADELEQELPEEHFLRELV